MYNSNFNGEIESGLNLGEKSISSTKEGISVGYELNAKTKENRNKTLLNTLGISYDEFDTLDFEKQQRIIREYHKKVLN